jgi:hypothetical protein
MNYYTHGGLANVAQTLAKQGRHGDTQLIHVSPKELHGLQALAAANGTSLTINPHTGLPEAFNFKKLLPMAAGAALTIGSGGTLTPLMAAGIVGGGYGLATGSIQKGLMAGIGAYGGAGLGAGLAEAGVSNLVETGGQEAVKNATAQQITEEAAKDQIVKSSLENQTMDASRGMFEGASRDAITSQQIAQTQAQNAINSQAFPNLNAEGISGLKAAVPNAENPMDVVRSAGMGNAANSAQVINPTMGQSLSNVGNGITQLGSKAGLSAAYAGMPTGTLPALGVTALDASQKEKSSVPGYQEDEYDRRLKGYKLSPNYQAYTAPTPNPYYRPTYAAIGGIMNSNAPHSFDDESGSDNVGMAAGGMNMASGGIAGLGGYSDGGRMLKGPGDGMSDSIPGVIGGKQPARLADGEFVVPADVVSHLGNGSTDAGAKKLYSMMDKVRQARTGKKKQAPQVDMAKYMPMGKASGGITGYAEGGAIRFAAGGFTDAQVASYIQNNATTPAAVAEAQAIFGISNSQLANAQALIAAGSPSINQATAAYNASIAANPNAAAENAAFIASQQAAIAAGRPTYASTISSNTTTPVTPVSPVVIDTRTTGPGGYTIPTFPPGAIASYIKTQGITTPAQFEQLKLIFNVNDAQIATAQNLIKNNDPIVDATTAKYYADIKANPGQVAQNANDFAARAAQLGISTKDLLIKPTVEVPLVPLVPVVPTVTPQSTTTTGPLAGSSVYRPNFVPRTSGVNMSPAIQDPYSNQGLQSLYSQMMGQYAKPTPQMSDAEVKALAERAFNSGSGGGAEVGRKLINAGIPVKQAISALRSYSGITPEIVNQAYIGGQSLGVTPPPTLNTQYNYSDPATYYKPPAQNNLILTTPIVDAAFKAPVAADTSGIGGRLAAAVDNSG